MKKQFRSGNGVLAAICMLVIILDGKTALNAAGEGLELCIRAVIPALFPFFVLSGIISSNLLGKTLKPFRLVGRVCKIPRGCESLLAVGFLSGYPVGAQLVTQAYQNKAISEKTARRMLGFCSNAGPSFLFGMLAPLFDDPKIPWIIWCIHIISALMVGWILPEETQTQCRLENKQPITVSQALRNAIENIAMVCGWVLVFRVILGFCNRWFLWLFPAEFQVLCSGVLELSNGCVLLRNVPVMGTRFLLGGTILSFGGICVMMQTATVTQELGLGYYFPGKVLQTVISAGMCCMIQPFLFSGDDLMNIPIVIRIGMLLLPILLLYILRRKKVVAFERKILYNMGS